MKELGWIAAMLAAMFAVWDHSKHMTYELDLIRLIRQCQGVQMMERKNEFMEKIKGATITDLDSDGEIGVMRITLGDGRVLAVFRDGVLINDDEAMYQERRARYIRERDEKQKKGLEALGEELDELGVAELPLNLLPDDVQETISGMIKAALKGKENRKKVEVVH